MSLESKLPKKKGTKLRIQSHKMEYQGMTYLLIEIKHRNFQS